MPALIEVGREAEFWVNLALDCLPDDVWDAVVDRLSIMSMATSDGRRLTPKFTQDRHGIVISERIIPQGALPEDHELGRYLMFVVLHEVAHASCDHQPPNEITVEENQRQEDEANTRAFDWLNTYLDAKIARGLPLTRYTQQEFERVTVVISQAAQVAHANWQWPPRR